MGFEHKVPTIDLTRQELPVGVECMDLPDGGTAFKVSIPDGYEYPTIPKRAKVERDHLLPPPDAVKKFPEFNDFQVLENKNLPFDHDGGADFKLEFSSNEGGKFWKSPYKLPKYISDIVSSALIHETSINPDISNFKCRLDIRVQKYTNRYWPSSRSAQPHFDNSFNQEPSYYFLSSPPTTVVYTGPYEPQLKTKQVPEVFLNEQSKMTPSSVLPWTLMHANYAVFHSQPWGMLDETKDINSRFFLRVTFYVE